MKRHASADELADLGAGVLKPRKARKISAHLADCAYCTDVSSQFANVSSLLATAPIAPMPANLSSRIESAIAAESAQRLASEPGTEAGRRDLPARGWRPRRTGQGWSTPLLSGPASRLVAAAGALVIIGGGGYEIAAHIGATSGPSVNSGSQGSAVVPPGQRLSAGPSMRTVSSDTNFTAQSLGTQAVAALKADQVTSPNTSPGAFSTSGSSGAAKAAGQSHSLKANREPPNSTAQPRQLADCVAHFTAGRRVLLVELAKFDGQPATIIVIASATVGSADVWAVPSTCSATNTQVLDHVRVAHT